MRFGNIGKKDEYGKQRRVEHRGKYLRASRTGLISVRAQTKAAGFNLTANAKRGVRVSRTVAKNTQVAIQNGRFVLRGRYGKGPTKINLSKTGATVSTRNRMGTINWVKPGRSSAKIAGVQVRGKNAVALQLLYFILAGMVAVAKIVWALAVLLFQAVIAGIGAAADYRESRQDARRMAQRDERNDTLQADAKAADVTSTVDPWNRDQTLAALILIYCAWGRGAETLPMVGVLHEHIRQDEALENLRLNKDLLTEMAHALFSLRKALTAEDLELVILSAAASHAAEVLNPQDLPEIVMELDELSLMEGQRTEGQEIMLEVMSDFGGLGVTEAE